MDGTRGVGGVAEDGSVPSVRPRQALSNPSPSTTTTGHYSESRRGNYSLNLRHALAFPPSFDRLVGFVGLTVAVFLHGNDGRPSLEGVLYSVCPETGALALLCGADCVSSPSLSPSLEPSLKLVFAHSVEQVFVVPGSKSAAEMCR